MCEFEYRIAGKDFNEGNVIKTLEQMHKDLAAHDPLDENDCCSIRYGHCCFWNDHCSIEYKRNVDANIFCNGDPNGHEFLKEMYQDIKEFVLCENDAVIIIAKHVCDLDIL
jgi:hypothetical protein